MFEFSPTGSSPKEVLAQRLINELASLAELRAIGLAYAKSLAIPEITRIEDAVCDERRRFRVDGLDDRDAKFVAILAGIGCAALRCDAIEEAMTGAVSDGRHGHIRKGQPPCSSPPVN